MTLSDEEVEDNIRKIKFQQSTMDNIKTWKDNVTECI